ncbi:MAG: WYL domain-containing protein [Nitrospinae bacterium]|nr:WYL domain-containing protein [Nitrospinota bacterium]
MALQDQFIRRWRLLRALESGENWSYDELLALLSEESTEDSGQTWSLRTLQRDISHLIKSGFPMERVRAGRKMRYRLLRGYVDSVPKPFSPSQWASLYYALCIMRDLPSSPLGERSLGDSVSGVFSHLRGYIPAALRAYAEGVEPRYAGVVGALREHGRQRRVGGVLREAIEKGKPARILAARAGEIRKRWWKVDPYLLHFDGGSYHLLARESEKNALDVWHLEGIESVRLMAGAFQMPLGLDLKALLAECLREAVNNVLNVRVRFGRDVALHAVVSFMKEAFGEVEHLKKSNKSSREVLVRVSDTWGFRRWLMSFGQEAELMAPAELRDAFAQDLEAALKKYRKGRRGRKASNTAL